MNINYLNLNVLLIFIFCCLSNFINAQDINVSFDIKNNNIEIYNGAQTSLSFTIKTKSNDPIKSDVVISAGRSHLIPYDNFKELYKGLYVDYYYSREALDNDHNYLDRKIRRREKNKFWEDLFRGGLSAADEYYTGGKFSTLKSLFSNIQRSNTPEGRENILDELAETSLKNGLKDKMTKTEKAIFEGMITVVESNLSEDPSILYFKMVKAKLTAIQSTSKYHTFKTGKLIKRRTRSKLTFSAATFNGLDSPGDSIKYVNTADNFRFEDETTYNFRINFDHLLVKNITNFNLSIGVFAGVSKYPSFIFRNEKISLTVPNAGLSGKIIIGNAYGISGGIDLGISYNSPEKNKLVNSQINKYATTGTIEASIFTPVIIFNIGIKGIDFNKKYIEDSKETVYINSSYFGIEIPLFKKRQYYHEVKRL